MKKALCLLLLVAFVAVGFWARSFLFPNPKQAVTRQLNKLAHLASFPPNEGNFSFTARIERLGAMFAEDAQVTVDVPGYDPYVCHGRGEVMHGAMLARSLGNGVQAQFLDMNIEMGSDNASALVDATLQAKLGGENDFLAQEMKLTLKRINGDWIIVRVEPVKTLKP